MKLDAKKKDVEAEAQSEYLISSDEEALLGGLAIHGPRRVGKSHLAATASALYPETIGVELATLEDLVWIAFDKGATAFAPPWKLRLPYVVDVNRLIADKGDALAGAMKAVEIAAATPAEWIVVDTVSMYDKYLSDWANNKVDESNGKAGFEIYRHMLNAHKRFYVAVCETGKKPLFLCHSKALSEATTDQAAKVKRAVYATAPDIVPDITGQSATVYLGNCSAQIVVGVKVDPKTKAKKRVAYVGQNAGYEGGSRWEGVFGATEELEPNIRKMLARVSGQVEQG